MLNSTAYFAGVATVFTATALGFGGALFLTSSTASRSPAEPTKLERSVAAPAQAVPSPDGKSVAASTAGSTQDLRQTSPAVPPQRSAQQSAANSSQEQTASTAQMQASPQSAATEANQSSQSTATSVPQPRANAYARSTDEDIRKYVRKRDRRWARRHYRDEDAIAAKASEPIEQPVSQSLTADSSAQSEPSQANQPQAKSSDQDSAKVNDADAVRSKRRHDRRWARSYARDDDSPHEDNRGQSLDMRETPQDQVPLFIARPRWRPFFSADDAE